MPLVSVQTKLSTVLALTQQLRGSCVYYVQRFGDGNPVQTQELVNLAKQFREIATRAAPFVGDAAVSAEADRQFAGQSGWQAGALLALLGSILQAVEGAITLARSAVPFATHSGSEVPITSTWNADGTTTPFAVDSAAVQSLRTALSGIVSGIPE